MSIESVSESGLLTLAFTEPLIIYDLPQDDFMLTPQQFLSFEVVKHPNSAYTELPEYRESGHVLSVEVTKFLAHQIQIQLTFSNPMYISMDILNRDHLLVVVTDP